MSWPPAALPAPPPGHGLVMATDGHVISPLFFPGGDIGCLSVHGTVNDVAMMGAVPLYLSASFILEEGFPLADLKRVVDSMAAAARAAGVPVVTGDTKVVEQGKGDGVFIATTGVGVVPRGVDIGAFHRNAERDRAPHREAEQKRRIGSRSQFFPRRSRRPHPILPAGLAQVADVHPETGQERGVDLEPLRDQKLGERREFGGRPGKAVQHEGAAGAPNADAGAAEPAGFAADGAAPKADGALDATGAPNAVAADGAAPNAGDEEDAAGAPNADTY